MTSAVIVIPVASTPVILIIPFVLLVFIPLLLTLVFWCTSFDILKTRASSTSISIFFIVRMKVRLVTKNLARSRGPSRILGSRRSMVKLVQGLPVVEGSGARSVGGRVPERARS
jgi:hypothetical protein